MTVEGINPTVSHTIKIPTLALVFHQTYRIPKQNLSVNQKNFRIFLAKNKTKTYFKFIFRDMRNTTEIKRSDSVSSTSSSSSSSSPSRKNSLSPRSTLERLRRKLSSKRGDDREAQTYGGGDLERVFRYFDENGDGKISAAELESCVKAIGGDFTSDEARRAVESTDSDGDGLLEFNDFVKLMEVSGEEEKNNDLNEAFKMYEMDGSGIITPKSLKRMSTRLGESKTTEECRTMIRLFDLNDDGVLSFDEFSAMMV
ncbi:putative calcium-binding protein CML19 [Papaver somniferum]|nr:putative calcium-binding protein CML19 [Papaver somniferum]